MNKNRVDIDFIPPHFNCSNCGNCCGPVPISKKESSAILNYCTQNNIKLNLNVIKSLYELNCPFRDTVNKKCVIYPVRPDLCKLFGVVRGMDCDNGNSNDLDGYVYLSKDIEKTLDNMKDLMLKLRRR